MHNPSLHQSNFRILETPVNLEMFKILSVYLVYEYIGVAESMPVFELGVYP